MRNNILYLVGFLYLSLFLDSCQSDEESGKVGNGKPMEVKFRFDGIKEFKEAGPNARWANGQEESQTVTQDLGNGRVMEATIVADEDGGAMTRGMTLIDPAIPIVVIAYRNGKPYKKKTITSNNASIELPMGETYDLVFYAWNNSKDLLPPAILTDNSQGIDDGFYPEGETGVVGEVYSGSDMIWHKVEKVHVSADMSPLTVVFQHLFSRIRLQVTNKDNLHNITECIAYATPVADYVPVDVTTGIWNNNLSNWADLLFSFPTQNDKSITSNYEVFTPITAIDISLVASLKIGTTIVDNRPFAFPGYKLQGGKSYSVKLNLKVSRTYSVKYHANGGDVGSVPASQTKIAGTDFTLSATKPTRAEYAFLGWSLNANATIPNFVAGARVTDADLGNSTVTNSTVTLYAVWQSLIAEPGEAAPRIYVSGSGDSAMLLLTQAVTNYGTFFQFGRVIAWDYDNNGNANYNPSTDGSSIWDRSLFYGEDSWVIVHINANLKVGKGDPCRLVGMTAKDIRDAISAGQTPNNGLWRLPTTAENGRMYAGSVWTIQDGIAGLRSPKSPLGTFLPAAGFRDRSGYYASRGADGYYWSNTQFNLNSTSYRLYFTSVFMIPQDHRAGQNYGFSVRCVRQYY